MRQPANATTGTVATGHGNGKVILFGDHFVVHGSPSIASGIRDATIATIEPSDEYVLVDERPATEGYKAKKQGEMERSMRLLLDFMDIDVGKTPVKITLAGDLLCTSGIGASAAMATAIARAFSDYFDLGLDDEAVNAVAFEAEKGSAGTPSGIDNTCSTFPGLLWFVRGEPNVVERIAVAEPIGVVLGSTGLTSETKEVVGNVWDLKSRDPEGFERILAEERRVVHEAREALERGALDRVGELLDRNQELLREIDVSCNELELLIDVAKKNGALGAKLTGTGRGGYMVALTPEPRLQEQVAAAIESAGFRAMTTQVGVLPG